METASLTYKHGWVWLFALTIFFFNTWLLPEGYCLSLLLTPVWLMALQQQGRLRKTLTIAAPMLALATVHIAGGANILYYCISAAVLVSILLFISAAVPVVSRIHLDLIFRDIALLNFCFVLASIPLYFLPGVKNLVWYTIRVSDTISLTRLKLFTEEASHYSFLLAPVAIYFLSRLMFFKTQKPLPTLFMIALPLMMSFSLGVLSCLAISGFIMCVCCAPRIFNTRSRRLWLFGIAGITAVAGLVAWKYFPNNTLFARVHNSFTGEDTSARGRTYEAFILAHKIIAHSNPLWGIGPGQLKVAGRQLIIQYYYYFKIPDVIRIPNAAAETIVYFGYAGLALRISLEVALFITTRAYRNPYRLWLFIFVFIYQFTGSYITNTAEYLIWLLAFSPIFPEYIKSKKAAA